MAKKRWITSICPGTVGILLCLMALCTMSCSCAEMRSDQATGEYYIYDVNNGQATLLKYGVIDLALTPSTIQIPPSIDGIPLCSIGENAFNCFMLNNGKAAFDPTVARSLVLPEGMTTLLPYAFNGAYGFETIMWPSTITDAQGDFMSNCTATIHVADQNARYVSEKEFLIDRENDELLYASPSASEYELPQVKRFAELSLQHYQPKTITFPETTQFISSYTCYDNTLTQTVIIPESVQVIEDEAFYAMAADRFIIKDGVRKIGAYAFYNTEISEISIPDSVEFLGYAFCDDNVVMKNDIGGNCHCETEDEYLLRTGDL